MSNSETDGTAQPGESLSLEEIQEFIYELERLGLVKRTGEFQNGKPVFISTVEAKDAMDTRPRKEG